MLSEQSKEKLLAEMEAISGNEKLVEGTVSGTIDREKQESFTMGLFANQADQAKRSSLGEYAKSLDSWVESASSRARLVVVEGDPGNLEQLARITLNASPLERVVIVGLHESMESNFKTALKALWAEKLKDSSVTASQFLERYAIEADQQSFEDILNSMSVEDLLGPHLAMRSLDIGFENMAEKFPQFDINLEEVLCYGKSAVLAEGTLALGQNISSGVPVFTVRSTPSEGADLGLWKCACKDTENFAEQITEGKTAHELIGEKTDDGYQNVIVCPTYQELFELESLKRVMESHGFPNIEDLEQEDLDFFKKILFQEALYPANTSPEAITKTISKTNSKLGAIRSIAVSKALWWNLVNRPVSTSVETEFALGRMTLDGGNDLIKENLDKKDSYKLFFEQVLVKKVGDGPEHRLAKEQAFAETINAYCAIEKRNNIISELTRGEIGAEEWRNFGLSETNKVRIANIKAINSLQPTMPLFMVGVATAVTGLVLSTVSGVPFALGLGVGVTGMASSAAATVFTGFSVYHQKKAIKKYLGRAVSALAQANSKMFDAQREREVQIAKRLAGIKDQSLSESVENHQRLQFLNVAEQGLGHDGIREIPPLTTASSETTITRDEFERLSEHDTDSEIHSSASMVFSDGPHTLDTDMMGVWSSENLIRPRSERLDTDTFGRDLWEGNWWDRGISTTANANADDSLATYRIQDEADHVVIDISEPIPVDRGPTKENFLDILRYIDQENDVDIDGKVHGIVDREKQLSYTMDLFLGQAHRSKHSKLGEYGTNLNSWVDSASSRARLVLVEATAENLKQLAEITFNAGPLERVVIVGLDEGLKSNFRTALKELWAEKLCSSSENADQFRKLYGLDGEVQSWEDVLNNGSLEDLLGPHLYNENLEVGFERMSEKFPQFDANIEEILCFGKSPELAKKSAMLGQSIGAGVPIFAVKSAAISDADIGLWKCACKDTEAFTRQITFGKSAIDLIGTKTDAGYENVTICPSFRGLLSLDNFKEEMTDKEYVVPENLTQEDLDFFEKIFFEEALYPADTSPVAITKTISKATSKLMKLGGGKVADSLIWNLVKRPVSAVLDVEFAIANMTLDGGNDLVKEELDKKKTYKQFFENLRISLITEHGHNAKEATQKAFTLMTEVYCKNEKENVAIQRLVGGECGAEEWRDLGLESTNATREIATKGVKNLMPLMPIFLGGTVLGGVGFGLSWASVPAVVGTALSTIGVGGALTATAFVGNATRHLVNANKKLLPIANFAFAQANAKMYAAQRARDTETERQLVAIKELESVNNIGHFQRQDKTLEIAGDQLSVTGAEEKVEVGQAALTPPMSTDVGEEVEVKTGQVQEAVVRLEEKTAGHSSQEFFAAETKEKPITFSESAAAAESMANPLLALGGSAQRKNLAAGARNSLSASEAKTESIQKPKKRRSTGF